MKKWLIILFLAVTGTINYPCKASSLEDLKNYTDQRRSIAVKQLPSEEDKRKEILQTICSQSNITSLDFRFTDLQDKDFEDIAIGLAKREHNKGNSVELSLLNFSDNDDVSEEGIKSLLSLFQNGLILETAGNTPKTVRPDVRQLILKLPSSVDLTDELLEDWGRIAPSVFAGGLRVVD